MKIISKLYFIEKIWIKCEGHGLTRTESEKAIEDFLHHNFRDKIRSPLRSLYPPVKIF